MPLSWFRLIFTEARNKRKLYIDFQADETSALVRYKEERRNNAGKNVDWKLVEIEPQSGAFKKIIAMNEA